jgi:predicted membrane-bound spermidine synthase
MSISNKRRLYLLFFVSGFCSLVYQMVWTRLAFASFGIITPVLSVVLSVFMLGLSVGAWAGGRIIPCLVRKTGLSAIFFYGGAELIIGVGAFATPALFALGQQGLLAVGQADSFRYLFLSALVLAVSILPWCLCMGATFPWMMAYVREEEAHNADSFSYLYYANVLGAMTGTILTALVLVETLGFHRTLALAAAGNFAIAALAADIGWKARAKARAPASAAPAPEVSPSGPAGGGLIRWILFTTGF